MIEFRCQHCGQKLTAGAKLAGRDSQCPRCRNPVAIPSSSAPEPSAVGEEEELTLIDPVVKPHDEALLDLTGRHGRLAQERAEERRQEKAMLESLGFAPAFEHTGERRSPWLIDILLYPTSSSGLTILTLLVGIPLSVELIDRFVPFVGRLCLVYLIASVAFGLYVGYYFAECVYDSAKGGTRAPQVFGGALDWGEMWSRVSYLVAVCIIYVLPTVIYGGFLARRDAIFWALVAYSAVFFPMGFLAMVMLDSTSALNPLFLLGSILRAFLPYCGLMLLFAGVAAAAWLTPREPPDQPVSLGLKMAGLALSSYGAFLLAHILGRFYWRYQEKLDWDV